MIAAHAVLTVIQENRKAFWRAAMSWVALEKAISQKQAKVPCNQYGAGMVKATPPNEAPMSSCMLTIHQRLVLMMSINGLHSGLMTHGR